MAKSLETITPIDILRKKNFLIEKRMNNANRRESTNVIDIRNIEYPNPILEGIKSTPSMIYQTITKSSPYDVPEILKTRHMKEIDKANTKYNLKGKHRLHY